MKTAHVFTAATIINDFQITNTFAPSDQGNESNILPNAGCGVHWQSAEAGFCSSKHLFLATKSTTSDMQVFSMISFVLFSISNISNILTYFNIFSVFAGLNISSSSKTRLRHRDPEVAAAAADALAVAGATGQRYEEATKRCWFDLLLFFLVFCFSSRYFEYIFGFWVTQMQTQKAVEPTRRKNP